MLETLLKELELVFRALVQGFKTELQGIRSGRPAPELIEHIEVPYFDQMLPVQQLGSISVKPPRELDVTVWDHNAVSAVMKAIQDAKIGLSLSNEGNTIRAFLPPLSEERREELGKFVKRNAEDVRIKVRTHRDEGMKKVKAAETGKEINEDQAFKGKEKIQKLVDDANKQIEELVESKLKELQE